MPGFVFTINSKKILNSTLDLGTVRNAVVWSKGCCLIVQFDPLFNLHLGCLFHVCTGSTQSGLKDIVCPFSLCKVELQWQG